MTYTPGPWLLFPDNEVQSSDGKFIAIILWRGMTPNEMQANARLIATAPQLLEACKDLIYYIDILLKERYEMGLPEDHLEFIPEPISKALIAIAAAEGKP